MARSLLEHFESPPDPRQELNRQRLLVDIVAISVCGVIVGCDGPTAIRLWAVERGGVAGVRSVTPKDRIRRVLSTLCPEAFTRCFIEWVAGNLSTDAAGRLIAIDGKTLRRSHDKKKALGGCTW